MASTPRTINFSAGTLESPAMDAFTVVPSDSADLLPFARRIYVGTGGNVRILTMGGNDVIFTSVPSGTTLSVMACRIFSTNTTASNMLALV